MKYLYRIITIITFISINSFSRDGNLKGLILGLDVDPGFNFISNENKLYLDTSEKFIQAQAKYRIVFGGGINKKFGFYAGGSIITQIGVKKENRPNSILIPILGALYKANNWIFDLNGGIARTFLYKQTFHGNDMSGFSINVSGAYLIAEIVRVGVDFSLVKTKMFEDYYIDNQYHERVEWNHLIIPIGIKLGILIY